MAGCAVAHTAPREATGGDVVAGAAPRAGPEGAESAGSAAAPAFSFREDIVLGRKGCDLAVALPGGAARRFQVAVALSGSAKQPVLCSARLVTCQSKAGGGGRREETPVIDGFQIQGKTCSASQVFDVPALTPSASVHLVVELGPSSGFRRVEAEVNVVQLPEAPQSSDSSTRRICHLRASSRHFDENTDLAIANEYCGAQDLPAAPSEPAVLSSSLPSCLPSTMSALSADGRLGWDERPTRSTATAARTTPRESSEQGRHTGILGWTSKFRRPRASANSTASAAAPEGCPDSCPPRTWGWGRIKGAAETGRSGGGSDAQGVQRAVGFAAILRSPKVRNSFLAYAGSCSFALACRAVCCARCGATMPTGLPVRTPRAMAWC